MRFLFTVLTLLVVPVALMASDIAVTVYNSDLGVVSETRQLDFQKGTNRLAFTDVPSRIDPASVRFDLTGTGHSVGILEQNYAFDLVSPEQMYAKYIDKEIELIDKEGQLYSGILLAYSGGAITLKDKSDRIKIVNSSHITEVNFPALPDGLITRPTLFWIYNSDYTGQLEGKVSYQTSGMNWAAEYVGVLDANEKNLDLSGWSSIDNRSGKSFTDATLRLVAGDIHRAQPDRFRGGAKSMALAEDISYAGFEEKAFFEYHLYTLPRKATVADKEIKQISLFEPATTNVSKAFIYRPDKTGTKVEVAIKFVNSSQAGLGMPLPAGRIRMFKADDDGSLILLGEDRINHTPKNEELKVTVGYAFDITAEDRLANQTRVSPKVEDKDFEIELSNRKDEPITVEVEKKLYGYWDVLESTHEFTKKDASTIELKVPVGADAKVIVKYKVRFYRR